MTTTAPVVPPVMADEPIQPEPRANWFPATDLGNARRLVSFHGADLRYAPQLGTWLCWDGRRWAEDVTGEAERRAKAVVDALFDEAGSFEGEKRSEQLKYYIKSSSAGRLRAMVELARTEPTVPVTVDQLDSEPFLLNVRNGLVDLRTGALLPHDRARLLTKLAGTSYAPTARAPTWSRFIDDIFNGDAELAGFVQRFAGMCLTADVSEQTMIFAHGVGANGKSTMLNALRAAAGGYGLQLDPRILTVAAHEAHPTGLTDLRGARLVTTIETEAGKQLAETLVKQLTGGDPIRARRMRADYFEFMPTHKLILAGNHLPRINGTDHGIWRRIAVVPFEVTFEGDRQDKHLPAKLAAESPGILRWMVEGCLEWQRSGLCVPGRVRAATADYRRTEDHLGRFIGSCCVVGDTFSVTSRALREVYEQWCEDEGERAWSAHAIGRELLARGFDSAQVGAARTRSWLGIGLLSEGGERL